MNPLPPLPLPPLPNGAPDGEGPPCGILMERGVFMSLQINIHKMSIKGAISVGDWDGDWLDEQTHSL